MSGVEQQLLTNDLLRGLTEKPTDGLTGAVGYIGKAVTAATAETTLGEGPATWTYTLPRAAETVTVEVLNVSGQVVRRETGDAAAGAHAFAWDGRSQSGARLADGGAYTLRVAAVDATGGAVAPAITVSGVVRAVEQIEGAMRLMLDGGGAVPLASVLAVRQPA